jgi:geranylgeranyl transferase type-2 subunit alpha
MHGRKRAEYKARLNDPKLAAALATKATQWHAVTDELLKRRQASGSANASDPNSSTNEELQQQEYLVEDTLKIIEKALLVNPDPFYLWSQRRDYLLQDLESLFDITTEFRLTQGALERNPKAYAPWFHRKWTLQQQWNLLLIQQQEQDCDNNNKTIIATPQQQQEHLQNILQNELMLSAKFLSLDERNFHGWNYRRFIVALLWNSGDEPQKDSEDMYRMDGSLQAFQKEHMIIISGAQTGSLAAPKSRPSQEFKAENVEEEHALHCTSHNNMTERQKQLVLTEWAFTQYKIQENFSNGSAFHYRSKLLPLLVEIRGNNDKDTTSAVSTEQQMLQEELDLVKNAMFTEPDDQTAWWYMVYLLDWAKESVAASLPQILQNLKEDITELVQAEEYQTKWGLLGLHVVLDHQYQLLLHSMAGGGDDDLAAIKFEMNNILDKLQVIDPDRTNRYNSMKS